MFFLVNYAKEKSLPYVHVAPMEVCRDMTHLEAFFQDIVDNGGEGIILRDPMALPQLGRSSGYLKHKVVCRKLEPGS